MNLNNKICFSDKIIADNMWWCTASDTGVQRSPNGNGYTLVGGKGIRETNRRGVYNRQRRLTVMCLTSRARSKLLKPALIQSQTNCSWLLFSFSFIKNVLSFIIFASSNFNIILHKYSQDILSKHLLNFTN